MLTWLASVATLSFVLSATPGPNNVLFAASGAAVGYVRTLPGIVGMLTGFAAVLAGCAAGVGQLVTRAPGARLAMTVLASAYMLWLARRLWTASAVRLPDACGDTGPLTWWQMAVLQPANPKTWLASVAFASGYLAGDSPGGAVVDLLGVIVFLLVVSVSASAWTLFGAALRSRLSGSQGRGFDRALAVVAVATVATLWV